MFQLYEVEYISCEGNYRTASIVLEREPNEEPDTDLAQSTYYANSGCMGDDPSQMVGGRFETSFDDREALDRYCNEYGFYGEIYSV